MDIRRQDILDFVEQYAVLHYFFKPLADYGAKRILSPGSSTQDSTFSRLYATSLASALARFEIKVPMGLAAIVHEDLEMMRWAASSALNLEHHPTQTKNEFPINMELTAVRDLAVEYAKLDYAYNQLEDIRDDLRNGEEEIRLANELRAALRYFVLNVPDYLQRIVEDRLLEMFRKVRQVKSRTSLPAQSYALEGKDDDGNGGHPISTKVPVRSL